MKDTRMPRKIKNLLLNTEKESMKSVDFLATSIKV